MNEKRTTKRLAAAIAATSLGMGLLLLLGCFAPPVDVAGTWAGLITWAEGEPLEGLTTPITLVLVQDEATLTGEVRLMAGQTSFALAITQGKVTGNSFTIEAAGTLTLPNTPSMEIRISLAGTSDGTQMSGSGTETVGGVVHRFDWEADQS